MRWSFYIMLGGPVVAALSLLAPSIGLKLATGIQLSSLLLQLGGVIMVLYGIIKTFRDSDKSLREIFAAGDTIKVPLVGSGSTVPEPAIISGSGYIPQADVPIEDRLETLEKRQVKLFTQLRRDRKELEQKISSLSKELEQEKNKRGELVERLRSEREEALVSNLHLEMAGSAWVMMGVALQLLQPLVSG